MNRFRESKPIEGTLAEVYFEKRGLDVPNGLSGDTLRYHRNMPFLQKKGVVWHPAVVFMLRAMRGGEATGFTKSRSRRLAKMCGSHPARS